MRTLLVMDLFLTTAVILNAQEYVPFPTEDAHWNIYVEYGAHDSPPDTLLLRYSLEGDTIINSYSYKQVIRETGDTVNPSKEYVGALREDGMKIYYQGLDYLGSEHINDNEILLYDFSKKVNDTIIHIDESPQFHSIIINIDSVLVGSGYRKRYEVNSSTNYLHQTEYWIEGIGSIINGLLGHVTAIPTCCYHFWEHVCFKDQVVELVNPNFNSCYSEKRITNIEKPIFNHSQIKVFPNPIEDIIHIDVLESSKVYLVNIYSSSGHLIYSEVHTSAEHQIDLELSLSAGFYILEVSDDNGKTIGIHKFIK